MVTIEDITAGIENTTLISNGVSFAGQSLKLDTEADAKPVVEAIENCSSLDFLNLQGNTLGVDASRAIAKALEKHPEFKKAIWLDMFTGRMKTEIPKALQFLGNGLVTANARLTLLDLSDNAFGPIGVEGLASLLRSSSCYALEELKLNNNGLGIDGGKLLSRALLDCYRSSKNEGKALALKVFVAGRNRLENDGAKALAEVFQTIGTLEEIAMPQNGIYHVGITALSQSFRNNPNLEILNLNDNTFGQKGSKAIALVLPYLKELKEINFGDCLLKNSGALSLAEGLKHCDKLEKLTLEANEIRTEGGVQLIKVLMDKKNLISVNLNANHFGNRGKDEINALLKDVGKVETLDTLSGDESIESDDNEGDGDCEEHEQESNSECEGKNEEKGVQISCFSNYRHSVKFDSSGSEDDVEEHKQDSDSESESKTNRTTIPTIIVAEFLNKPTSENFSVLGPDPAKLFLQDLNKNGTGSVIEKLFMIVMKVASLNVCKDKLVCERSLKCTDSLYQYIFGVSNEESLPLINNTLLVYLGMIKNEDKFKPTWNIDGCLKALHNAVKKNYVPDNTKNTLKMFLQKDIENGKEFSNIKKDILTDLN